MATRLVDLDELVLSVRDRNSRAYIDEAVAAYRAGVYRAATVATWTALVYDVIAKIRELEVQGDAQARQFVTDLENAIKAQNLSRLQQIENDILQTAENPFELIDAREKEDLDRLRTDRNHCAHPAFVAESLLYMPTPELVRSHIVHAISHVLEQPPVQGKAALDRVKADILQPTFPQDQGAVTTFMYEKYLKHAKRSLVETLVVVLLKVVLRASDANLAASIESVVRCLIAISQKNPASYELKMREQLPKLATGAEEARLFDFLLVIAADVRSWNWLDAATKIRITEMIRRFSFQAPAWRRLCECLPISELAPYVVQKFNSLTVYEQEAVVAANPHPAFADWAVLRYAQSHGWRDAERIGEHVILPMSIHMSAQHVEQVLGAVKGNSQIWDAAESPDILGRFYDSTASHRNATIQAWRDFRQFVQQCGRDYSGLLGKMQTAGI